eukprot:g7737.t1
MYQDYLDEVLELNDQIEKKIKVNQPASDLIKECENAIKALSVESRKLQGKERRAAAQDIKNLKMKVEGYKKKELFDVGRGGSSFLGQASNNLRMTNQQIKQKAMAQQQTMQRGTARLKEAQRVLGETEEDAKNVMDQLEQNRKVIDRNLQRNKEINNNLQQADKLVDKMKKWWKNL